MSDEISDLVDWQLANRPAAEAIVHVCRVCLARWTCDATSCPECEATQ
jgi:ribosomal protein L40E